MVSNAMWCPSCGAEYRPGFTHCPDCDVELVAEPPAEAERPARRLEPQLVPVFSGELEDGESVQQLLRERGIPSAVAEAFDDEIEVNVVVAAEQVPLALEVLERSEWGSLLLEEGDPEFEEGVDVDEPDGVPPAQASPAIGEGGGQAGPIAESRPWWSRRRRRTPGA